MKRFLTGFGLGLAGVALALGLTIGALAVAGPKIGDPPIPPVFDTIQQPSPSPIESPAGKEDTGKDDDRSKPTESPTASPSIDDHPSGGSDDHGSDDSGSGGSDDSGSGGSDDSSGSGGDDEADDD